MNIVEQAHEKAVIAAKNFKQAEANLLEALIEVDRKRVFEKMGYPSLHAYCVEALHLTDAQAYNFIGVARKSRQVPELQTLVSNGSIHLTNARRIAPVLTEENKAELFQKAKDLSYRELERELVRAFPQTLTKESVRPVAPNRLEMKVFITAEMEKDLKRMQDVLSQRFKKPCSMEEVLKFMVKECLERHDPVKRAERAKPLVARRAGSKTIRAIPAPIAHEVVRRDQGQCTFTQPNGKRCSSQRWLQRHHKTPWARGGSHSLDNLTTLCSTHHRHIHDNGLARAIIRR